MSDSQVKEFEGKTMEEALAAAAQNYGVSPDDLEVEVLKNPGSLGSLLGRRVVIAATPKNGNGFNPEGALNKIVAAIMPEATVEKTENEEQIVLDIVGDGSGIFIGRKGDTLEAIQFLLTRMAQKQGWEGKRLVVESEKYRERRAESLRDKAAKMARKAVDEGRVQTTEMLNAADRHVIHTKIKDIQGVESQSFGQGDLKRVRIIPEGVNLRPSRGNGGGRDRDNDRGPRRGGRGGSRGGGRGDRRDSKGPSRYDGPPKFEG